MKKIGIIGVGNMGGAIYQALAKIMDTQLLYPCDSDEAKIKALHPQNASTNFNEIAEKVDVLILAIKPQSFEQFMADLTINLEEKIIISIMAGVSMKKLSQGTKTQKIIRSMPNLPVQVEKGVVGWIASPEVTNDEKNFVREIFSTLGQEIELQNENLINSITALSGSGPAYFFYLCELMVQKAQQLGFEKSVAQKIAEQTLIGSALLLEKNSKTAAEWRTAVTSKGGTTEAALKKFEELGLPQIISSGIEAAKKRAEELSG